MPNQSYENELSSQLGALVSKLSFKLTFGGYRYAKELEAPFPEPLVVSPSAVASPAALTLVKRLSFQVSFKMGCENMNLSKISFKQWFSNYILTLVYRSKQKIQSLTPFGWLQVTPTPTIQI